MSARACLGLVVVMACGACDSDPVGPQRLQSTLTLVGASSIDGTGVVISEFASRSGPTEACSEFVELRNDTLHQQSVGGWRVSVSGPGGPPAFYAYIPVGMVLEPGCHLLIATQPSGLLRDVASECNLADTGGLALLRPDGTIVDQVGMSASGFHEGIPLAPFPVSAINKSYTRLRDTDDNAADFVFGPATPQNRFDPCTTP